MDYLEHLNEPQRKAVLHIQGPLMIIAGAGSGKTRVLTYRIAHLIQEGVDPFSILALTFTNKAAREMQQRIEKVVGANARNIWMGTFHAVFAKILRFEAHHIGYTNNFSIYDTDDSKSIIKAIVKELNLDDKQYKASYVYNRISGAKNRLISATEYNNNPIFRADDESALRPEIGRIYTLYQQRCFQANAMDFDDLLFNTNVLFRDHLDVLNKYQHKFKYVMVDEFQDTNLSQYLITKKLAAVHQNICVVGDDAQSIYAFRGADIQNILNFEKDYPQLETIRLEQNYRSTKTIVNAANSIIKRNKAQLRKEVWTHNHEGPLIEVIKATTDNEEGRLVVQDIYHEKLSNQLKNNDIAILYRTNAQSRAFEEALRKMNISYRIIGGLSFYQRKEIKDIIAYLKYTINSQDEAALKRIINLPKRGIGDTTVAKILVTAQEKHCSSWDIIANIHSYLPGRVAQTIDGFAHLVKSFKLLVESKDAYEAAAEIAQRSGLLKELYTDKTVEGLARYENVQELLNGIKEFVDHPENEDKSLATFLQEISLLTNADEDNGAEDKITLMTIHSAKGLEFKYVYIVGMEEDLFPSQLMLQSSADLEEERRLFYVAVTRAEERLKLSYAISRYRFGRIKDCEPSRFIDEIHPDYIKTSNFAKNNIHLQSANVLSKPSSFKKMINQAPKKLTKKYQPSTHFKPSDASHINIGMKVEHLKFGFGVVKDIENMGNDKKAKIAFEEVGEKTLLLSFAKLQIHE